jgi:ubiquinone/menaquinone biosynthesis C-methylase UbiE
MKKLNPDDWSPFWTLPTITSFGHLFPDNYDGEFLDFWQGQLAGEPNQVVDLACGNGALTWICDEILNQGKQQISVTGVDFSSIQPFKVLKKKQEDFPCVSFIGNTAVENLPYEDNSVDLIVSQYGVEYSDLTKTIPELVRVLSPKGKIAFIMHDVESIILTGALKDLGSLKAVFHGIKMHDLGLELAALYKTDKNLKRLQQSREYQHLMSQIGQAAAKVNAIMRLQTKPDVLNKYVRVLNSAFEQPKNKKIKLDREKMVRGARDSLKRYIMRIEDLESAALSAAGRDELISLCEKQGLQVTENRALVYGTHGNCGTAFAAKMIT